MAIVTLACPPSQSTVCECEWMQACSSALGTPHYWRRVILFVPFGIFLSATQLRAQDDVAAAARQEQARKAEQKQKSAHVYTDEDLKRNKILIPEDQARAEARKKLQTSAPPPENAQVLPADPNQQTESLGEIARKYRNEKATHEAAEAAKKSIAPFSYAVPNPGLAAPKPEVGSLRPGVRPLPRNAPEVPTRKPIEAPLLPAPHTSNQGSNGRPRISPFQPRPLLPAAPDVVPVVPVRPTPPAHVERQVIANTTPAPEMGGTHTIQVQRGDSWWKLAGRYLGSCARWQQLRALNHTENEPIEFLKQGTTILVPDSTKLRVATPKQQLIVKKGDTLWALAREHLGHGSAWGCLASANPEISNYTRLVVGSVLSLPSADAPLSCKAPVNKPGQP